MIAQVVFDLPLDGPFDYLIPTDLLEEVSIGRRVTASFGARRLTGFIVGLLEKSSFQKLKSIQSLKDDRPRFLPLDLDFAKTFSLYYGCSLGQSLALMDRSRRSQEPSIRRELSPKRVLYQCSVDQYPAQIHEIIKGYGPQARFLILVPDVFRAQVLSHHLQDPRIINIGSRSCVFECDGHYDAVIMLDDEDASYKQEQMPMYQTRDVLLMRAAVYGFDVAFVGTSPSVELMVLCQEGKVARTIKVADKPDTIAVDISHYKYMPGLISPPVYDALNANLKEGQKSVLVLNRRGSYRRTSCQECGFLLICRRCEVPLTFSRVAGKYVCPHCSYTIEGEALCPVCQKGTWRSYGIGVEQIQRALNKHFPQAHIISFARSRRSSAMISENLLKSNFDILISTQAFLRFQGLWQIHTAAFIDFDMELNRLNITSSFDAFRLACHTRDMTSKRLFFQTRQPDHYLVQSLSDHETQKFYDQELKIRKELGFSPFKHWITIIVRSQVQKTARETAQKVYNRLSTMIVPPDCVLSPATDTVTRRREKYIFNVTVQAQDVQATMALIKSALRIVKSRAMIAINVD